MTNELLINLVNSVLGEGKRTARGNQSYYCPFCNHHKPKLEINFTENEKGYHPWNCWVCGNKGTKIHTLFKKLEVSSEKFHELNSLIKNEYSYEEPNKTHLVELPEEFKPLINITQSNIIGRHALSYVKHRGVTEEDILKYNIGYCEKGMYANMIIIPSYDYKGNLNYFTARSFEKEPTIKYKNPSTSRDIIPFELFINWNLPLILCEGPFDAIAIKRNVIPLLGKNIQSNLMKKIVMSSVEKIYIALDKDAQKQALKFCELLIKEGKEVYLVDMKDKDPSDMGFIKFTNIIQETNPLTFSELLEKKLFL